MATGVPVRRPPRPATTRKPPTVPVEAEEILTPEEDDELAAEIQELEDLEIVDGPTVEVRKPPKKEAAKAPTKPAKPVKADDDLETVEVKPTESDELETTDEDLTVVEAPKSRKGKGGKKDESVPAASVPADALDPNEIMEAGAERDWRYRIILYGPNKTGKTKTLDDPHILVLNFEDGTTTLADKPKADRALQIPIRNRKKIEQVYWMLRRAKPGPDGKGLIIDTKLGERHIHTVAFDTVTREVFWVLREAVLGDKRAEDLTIVLGSKETYYARGPVYEWINNWMVLFRDLPLHTVYLCQEREPKADEAAGASLGCPDVPPSIRSIIQGDVDVIGHTRIKHDTESGEPAYLIKFGPDEEYVTGDRFSALPKVIKNVPITKIMSRIDKVRAERE